MKNYLALMICLPSLVFANDVYRCTDDEGKTYYSDRACEGGKKMILPPTQTYTPSPTQRTFRYTPLKKEADQAGYDAVSISTPAHDSTIRDNTGRVTVSVSIKPALRTGMGHRLQLLLDGQPYADAGTATSFGLTSLDRGTHILKAIILDMNNKTLAESTESQFHVHKFSKIIQEQRNEQKKKEAQKKTE